ncbi:MAG: APC family permease [Pseudomonadota bacterium]
MTETRSDTTKPGPALRRRLGFWLLTLYGLGVTIGAGIYVLIGKVAGETGALMPLAFLAAAVLAGLTALSFAELAARFPRSAGEAIYIREGFGSKALSLIAGLAVALVGMVSSAAIAIGAAGYIGEIVPLPRWALITIVIVALTALACWGIKESVLVAGIVTVLEIAGLLLVVGVALPEFSELGNNLTVATPGDGFVWAGFMGAMMLAFFAFVGFEDMVNVIEEVKEPRRIMPYAIIATLIGSTVIYVLVALAALAVVPPAELAASDAPLALVYEKASGVSPVLLIAIASFATLNGIVIQTVMASRVLYGLSWQGSIPAVFCRINPRTHTPIIATVSVGALILVMALALPIEALAEATALIVLAIFTAVNLALGLIKRRDPVGPSSFAVPAFWPWLAFAVSLAILTADAARRLL